MPAGALDAQGIASVPEPTRPEEAKGSVSAEVPGGAALAIRAKNGHFCAVSTVAEIESAIEKLPPAELSELLAWIEEYQAMVGASDALFALYDKEEQTGAES